MSSFKFFVHADDDLRVAVSVERTAIEDPVAEAHQLLDSVMCDDAVKQISCNVYRAQVIDSDGRLFYVNYFVSDNAECQKYSLSDLHFDASLLPA